MRIGIADRMRRRPELQAAVITVPVEVGSAVDLEASAAISDMVAAGWRVVSATMSGSFLVAVFSR